MADFVKINGNKVLLMREEVIKEIGIDSFLANIEKNMGINTGILPRNCLYMRREDEGCVYLVEVPAGIASVSFKDEDNTVMNLAISIPFTQFYVFCNPSVNTILSIYMSVTKTPLVSVTQEVLIAPYLNIFGNGKGIVCTGSMQVPQDVPLNIKVNAAVSAFFEANFNADLTPSTFANIRYVSPKDYIMRWAKLTEKDRFFACAPDTKYYKHDFTPAQIMERGFER